MSTATTPMKRTRNRWHRLDNDEMDEVLAKEMGHAARTALFAQSLSLRNRWPKHYSEIVSCCASNYIMLAVSNRTEDEKVKAAKVVLANASDAFSNADGRKAIHLATAYLEAFLTGRH